MAAMVKNAAAVLGMLILLVNNSLVTEAVTCNPIELATCLSAFTSSAPPSTQCCNKLREQQSCLCQYVKKPEYAKYINSDKAKTVSSQCRVPYPSC